MENVKIFIEEDIEISKYEIENSIGIDLRVIKIFAVYKGEKKTSKAKTDRLQESFKKNGIIKIRPFERILFGTGIKILFNLTKAKDLEAQIRPAGNYALKKGLFIANSPVTISSGYKQEIEVVLYNSTPYLIQINRLDVIAQIVFNKITIPVIWYENDKIKEDE